MESRLKPAYQKQAGKDPIDRGKLDTKRSGLTHDGGVYLRMAVEAANRHDFKMALATITFKPTEQLEPTPESPQSMSLDKSYNDDE